MRLLAILTATLLLAGCASTSMESSSPTSSEAAATPTTSAASSTSAPPPSSSSAAPTSQAPRAAKTFTINITGNQFVDGTLTVQMGDTVHWVHKDGSTPHSVKADGGSFSSDGGLPCPGPGCMTSVAHSTFDNKFDAVGSFAYHCEVHASMKNTVTVVASA